MRRVNCLLFVSRFSHCCIGTAQSCLVAALLLTCSQTAFASGCFSDADLSALEKTQVSTVVYVWSPRMALSVLHADEAAQQAREAGLAFVSVADGRVPEPEWRAALDAANATRPGVGRNLQAAQRDCSSRLAALDAYQHFPSVFLVRSGQLQPNKWTGAMHQTIWASAFASAMKAPTTSAISNVASSADDTGFSAQTSPAIVAASGNACVAANQFVRLPPELAGRDLTQAVALGAYERISPDGRFILRSYSGKDLSTVSIMELPAPTSSDNKAPASVVAITQTPLSNEAFPVQGSWRYIVDTNGQHYSFGDLLKRQKQATPYFQGGMSGFYAAAAEVDSTYPSPSQNPVQIRSLSWPNPSADGDTVGEGMLTSRTITIEPRQNRLMADSGRVNLCLGRAGIDGSLYSLPMISVDGQFYSALPQRPVNNVATMRIFGFGADGKQCTAEQQFTSPSGKVTFGFAPQKPATASQPAHADLVYEYRGQAWWYDSASANALNLAPVEDRPTDPKEPYRRKIIASAFPGLTRDGRVIYAATWQLCKGDVCTDEGGYVVSDPYQSNAYQQQLASRQVRQSGAAQPRSCITPGDVLRERAAFANFHGLPTK